MQRRRQLKSAREVPQVCTYTNVHGIELCCVQIIHDLVGGEKSQGVWEVLEVLHDAKDAREILRVVACPWLGAIDALTLQRRIDINDHVNARSVEDGGASGVVELRIDVVDSDSVDLRVVSKMITTCNLAAQRKGRLAPSLCIKIASRRQTSASLSTSLPSLGL
jgi:hypothetical protein